MQVPIDTIGYPKVPYVWTLMMFFFTGLIFGLCNAGDNAQKVTDAVAWINRGLGMDSTSEKSFTYLNYSDEWTFLLWPPLQP